jgi:hypothetical protein
MKKPVVAKYNARHNVANFRFLKGYLALTQGLPPFKNHVLAKKKKKGVERSVHLFVFVGRARALPLKPGQFST